MQDLGLFGVLCHSIHLSLQLLSSDRALPVILQGLGIVQIIRHFLFQLCLRHHRIERWLGIRALPAIAGPDTVTPVHVFDCALIRHTFFEGKSRSRGIRRRLGMEERQSRSNRDQNETSCRCAKEETN
ncbi:MAG: hypothetical protein DME78_04100 [Verrucomicrobia bacterium]|nr:MAG: hypothetical protein DME78_04100 [Verrucomicrobiota bacterium]